MDVESRVVGLADGGAEEETEFGEIGRGEIVLRFEEGNSLLRDCTDRISIRSSYLGEKWILTGDGEISNEGVSFRRGQLENRFQVDVGERDTDSGCELLLSEARECSGKLEGFRRELRSFGCSFLRDDDGRLLADEGELLERLGDSG